MTQYKVYTERLLLRCCRPEDHAPFTAMCCDPDVMRYIGNGKIRTANAAARYIASFEKEWDEWGFGLFAVEVKQTGEFIGFTGLSWPVFYPKFCHPLKSVGGSQNQVGATVTQQKPPL